MSEKCVCFAMLFFSFSAVYAQEGVTKAINPYHEAYHDSLKR